MNLFALILRFRFTRSVLQLLTLLVISTVAHALPAPMSTEDLIKSSDFVGEVKVLGIIRVSDDKSKYAESVAQHNAWLQIISVQKGFYNRLDTILYCWTEIPKPPFVGAWYIAFEKHEKSLIYLQWNESRHCYTATSWNAKTLLKK